MTLSKYIFQAVWFHRWKETRSCFDSGAAKPGLKVTNMKMDPYLNVDPDDEPVSTRQVLSPMMALRPI